MADSKITKLGWIDTIHYIPRGTVAQVTIDNSFFIYTPDTKPRAFGRKPYLISKEYVPQGEPYDYLAMMNTEWDLGANNAWVVNRKPYKFKDYHLMTTGYGVIGDPVEKFYPTKVYLVPFNEFSKGITIASVSNLGSTTTASIVASINSSGSYYLYAEDGIGNKIYAIISSAVPVIEDITPTYSGFYYGFDELILGNLVTCVPNMYDWPDQPWLTPMNGSYTFYPASWSNADGYGTDYNYTYSLSNGEFISTLYTYSYASISYQRWAWNYSGLQMNLGGVGALLWSKREHVSENANPFYTTVYGTSYSYITTWYTFSGSGLPSILVSHDRCTGARYATGYSAQPLTQTETGILTQYQYANDDLYIYTELNTVSYRVSYETRYSGVYDASAFESQTLPFHGTTVDFYYI